MNKSEIRKDIQAFADDDANIVFDSIGNIMFTRNGQDVSFRVWTDEATSITRVHFEGREYLYRDFFSKEIARLDLFATKIIEKRKGNDVFIDGPAMLKMAFGEKNESCLNLLKYECDNFYEFATKVTFITADAGHGKTALLREFQYEQAKRYIAGESKFLFWHVDLQGRDLIRLPEAIMYDLAELRISGLFYSSILYLIKNKFIILAIDGFDELAAEIGGVSALGPLSSLVSEMNGQGTLVAASRRTFFDTNDYLKRTKYLKTKLSPDCEFNELMLQNWDKKEVIEYASYFFDNPQTLYQELLIELHNESSHPILTRPFLLSKTIQALQDGECTPSDFFSMINSSEEGVVVVVEAFTKREVNKWKEWDQQTGQPYLTFDQHMGLLSLIAKEMWENQKDNIPKEEVQFLTTLLLDDWKIEEGVKPKIIRLVESHAFLVPVSDNKPELRKFEHEEFKNYFLSRSLANIINESIANNKNENLKKFLYVNQLPDSVARYCFNYVVNFENNSNSLIEIFKAIISEEWKPSYLQQNIGTLIPSILDKKNPQEAITIDTKVSYTSLIFENKILSNIIFINGDFVNISFRKTSLKNIKFEQCRFNEIRFELDSLLNFEKVSFNHCNISSIVVLRNQEIIESAFSPIRITQFLVRLGMEVSNGENHRDIYQPEESDFKKLVNRFLLKFNKTIYQYEKNIIYEKQYGGYSEAVIGQIVPLLMKYNIIQEKETKQSKQSNTRAWRLTMELHDIYSYDGIDTRNQLSEFWRIANSQYLD